MTTDIPKPETAEQFFALPEGPAFGARTEGGITTPIAPDVIAFFTAPDDVISRIDHDGERWSLGRYRDGSWFRRRGL